jgi:hypothetical protein
MPLPVTDEAGFLCKGLSAYVADVRSLAGMNQYMLLLRGLSWEGFAADRAGERSDALMNPQVKLQVTFLAEGFAAGGTNDLLFTLVPDQMLIEILLRGQTTLADFAFVGRLVVSVFHMRLYGGYVFASVAADAANDGRFAAVHLIRVLLEVVLDFELFLADRAGILEAAGMLPYKVVFQGALVVALVLADAARVKQRSVNLLDMTFQLPFQTEALAAGLALILMLAHVLYHDGLLAKTLPARGAFQQLRFSSLNSALTEVLLSRTFPRAMILLLRQFSLSHYVSFHSIQ